MEIQIECNLNVFNINFLVLFKLDNLHVFVFFCARFLLLISIGHLLNVIKLLRTLRSGWSWHKRLFAIDHRKGPNLFGYVQLVIIVIVSFYITTLNGCRQLLPAITLDTYFVVFDQFFKCSKFSFLVYFLVL